MSTLDKNLLLEMFRKMEEIQAQVKEAVEASVKFAEESPFPPLESAFEDIYAD